MTEQELREMSNEDLVDKAFECIFQIAQFELKGKPIKSDFTEYAFRKELLRRLEFYTDCSEKGYSHENMQKAF